MAVLNNTAQIQTVSPDDESPLTKDVSGDGSRKGEGAPIQHRDACVSGQPASAHRRVPGHVQPKSPTDAGVSLLPEATGRQAQGLRPTTTPLGDRGWPV